MIAKANRSVYMVLNGTYLLSLITWSKDCEKNRTTSQLTLNETRASEAGSEQTKHEKGLNAFLHANFDTMRISASRALCEKDNTQASVFSENSSTIKKKSLSLINLVEVHRWSSLWKNWWKNSKLLLRLLLIFSVKLLLKPHSKIRFSTNK